MTHTEAAYMARILDGEGWIGASNDGRAEGRVIVPKVTVTHTNVALRDWAVLRTNAKWNKHHPDTKTRKKAFALRWNKADQQSLLEAVLPYLVLKKRQAKLVLALMDLKSKGRPRHCFRRDRQEAIKEELSELNKRGPDDQPLANAQRTLSGIDGLAGGRVDAGGLRHG